MPIAASMATVGSLSKPSMVKAMSTSSPAPARTTPISTKPTKPSWPPSIKPLARKLPRKWSRTSTIVWCGPAPNSVAVVGTSAARPLRAPKPTPNSLASPASCALPPCTFVRDTSPNVHGGSAQEAGLANEFGVGFGALRGLAAEVPTTATEFGAGPHHTIVEVLLHFLGSFLAKGFIDGGHDGFVGFVDIGVVLAGAGELVDIAFTIDGFESEPTVAIEAAIGIRPFFGEGLEIGEFLRFHFDDENIEIVSLRLDSDGRC